MEWSEVAMLRKCDCVTLPLVLKGKWFDMIACGAKREEYRVSRSVLKMIFRWYGEGHILGKTRVVEFYRGYGRDRLKMSFCAGVPEMRTVSVHPEMGEPAGMHCVIPIIGGPVELTGV